jgi:hypothetical protein
MVDAVQVARFKSIEGSRGAMSSLIKPAGDDEVTPAMSGIFCFRGLRGREAGSGTRRALQDLLTFRAVCRRSAPRSAMSR